MTELADNPYKPPTRLPSGQRPVRKVVLNGYASLLALSKWLAGLLAFSALFSAADAMGQVYLIGLYRDAVQGSAQAANTLNTLAEQAQLLELLGLLITLVSLLAFLTWVRRVHTNLRALERTSDIAPKSAVVAYFIPFLNLWRPYQHMKQAWRLSAPKKSERDTVSMIGPWWTVWVLRGLGSTAARLMRSADFEDQLIVGIITSVVSCAVAGLTAKLVLQLSERQERAAARCKRRWRKRGRRNKARAAA